ncbi:facilitated trehalose transporter Tret1-like [Armigeres subalbatus]|uniref:facilitated trehalose transporter Tret1-like n=1 Tax=Armigeres subalbatus TaxID=124917 RepID=UPI002ED46023
MESMRDPFIGAPFYIVKTSPSSGERKPNIVGGINDWNTLVSGYVVDNFGHKKAVLITEIPMIISWIIMACATNVKMIYPGRILTGLVCGMVGAPARVYTSEVMQPHLRGRLCALASTGVTTLWEHTTHYVRMHLVFGNGFLLRLLAGDQGQNITIDRGLFLMPHQTAEEI